MIYHEKRVRLPKPKYIVFYNGTKNQPDSMELRLSDCFENTDNEAPCLECTATMLNINYGHNQELMKHCRRLEEYSIFVQCVREYIQSEPSVEDALEKAIDTCINQDVLADFLKKHRAEVTNMILTTYDKDLYEKTLKEDAREEGRKEGMEYLNQLNKYLLKAKRYSDLERATEDIEYQKKLLKEFGIEESQNINPMSDHKLRCNSSFPVIRHGIFLFNSIEKFYSLFSEKFFSRNTWLCHIDRIQNGFHLFFT